MKSIKEKAVEVFLPSLSRNKGDDEGQENCKRRNHLLYLKNLLSFSIAEELIDYATLCACLVDAVSNKATEIDAFFLALCAEHAVQLVRNPSAWHKLLAVCTNFICNAHVHVGEERRSALRASFAQFLSLSVQVSPDIVAALEDDAFADISSLLEPIVRIYLHFYFEIEPDGASRRFGISRDFALASASRTLKLVSSP